MPYSINLNLKTQMNMKTTKYILTIALALVCTWNNSFAIDQSYYTSVNGKSGKDLFDAVHTVAKTGYKSLSYNGLWTAYCAIDLNASGYVWDMYSNATSYTCGSSKQGANSSKEGDAYNREHSIPKSWFGGTTDEDTPGTDLFHVVPVDGYINTMRNNQAFGEVSVPSYTSQSGCKKGTPKSISVANTILNPSGSASATCSSTPVFEPMDEYKGDFARGYLGTMTMWANGDYDPFTSDNGESIFNTAYDAAHYYGLTDYGVALLLKWHREDPVSAKEIARNNGIQNQQGNRNPFIDYPELVEYIWGNKAEQTVVLNDLTPTFDGGYTPATPTTYTVILSRNGQLESITGVSGTYNLPSSSDPACDGWSFAGWSTTKITSTTSTPSFVTNVSSACTVYAVYSKSTPNSAPRRAKKATPAEGTYKIYANVSGTKYYATGGLTSKLANTTTAEDATEFTFESASDGIAIKVNDKYLSYSSSTNFSTSDEPYYWVFATGTYGTWRVTSKNTTSRAIVYRSGTTNKFAPYAVSNINGTEYYDIEIEQVGGSSGGGGSTTYDSEPEDCNCSGSLGTPVVTATPSDETITLTWSDVADATNGYTVTISKGVGYTTECGETTIGEITHSGTTNTCVISGLINGIEYTTSVVANATSTTCESAADEDTATPVGCESWADPTFTYSTPLTAGGEKVSPTIGAGYGTPTFMSSNTSVLQVDEDGKVTPVGAGTATITAHWPGDGTHCPKDVVSPTVTVKGTVVLTFNANDGSDDPATTTQNFTYGEAQNLTANTFSRTGYTFQGWATSSPGAKVYDDGASITITTATTLFAVWQVNKHNVTFTQPDNGGTFTVNNSSSSPVTNVDFGSTVTIAIMPTNSHFTVNTVTVSGVSGYVTVSGTGNSYTFTMPDEDVTVSVTFTEETKYTVNWYVNGTPTAEENYAGETLVGIANPSIDCNEKVFQGWTATPINNEVSSAPDDLFTDASTKTMPVNGTNYYAVFATETTSGSGGGAWDGTTPGTYKIYAIVDDVKHYATASVSGGKISSTTNIAEAADFTFAEYNSGWSIKTGNTFITYSGSTNLNTSSSAHKWSRSVGTHGTWRLTSETSTRGWIYRAGSNNVFGCYATNNVTLTSEYYDLEIGGNSSTTYTDYTTSCTHEDQVTITFNANGGSGTMAAQVMNWGEATALNANTFTAPIGHHFLGWSESSTATTATYTDQESVTYKKDVTLYAVWEVNSHNVTFEPSITGATVTINGQSTSPQSANYNSIVTVAVTPVEHYSLTGITLSTGGSVTINGNSGTFTMPDEDVTVTVTMKEDDKYTVTWYVAGTTFTETHYAGVALEGIPAPTSDDCDGSKVFIGWTATANYSSEDTAPADLFTDPTTKTTPDNNTTTYYAVFAEEDSGSGEIAKATSIAVGDVVYLVYEEDLYELSGISTTSTKYGIGTHYSTIPAGLSITRISSSS